MTTMNQLLKKRHCNYFYTCKSRSIESTGYPNGILIWVGVKTNDQTVSTDFGKPKTFQLIYQFTISTTVLLFIRRLLIFYDFQFAYGVAKIDFVWKLEILWFENVRFFALLDTFFHNESVTSWTSSRTITSSRMKLLKIKKCLNWKNCGFGHIYWRNS